MKKYIRYAYGIIAFIIGIYCLYTVIDYIPELRSWYANYIRGYINTAPYEATYRLFVRAWASVASFSITYFCFKQELLLSLSEWISEKQDRADRRMQKKRDKLERKLEKLNKTDTAPD